MARRIGMLLLLFAALAWSERKASAQPTAPATTIHPGTPVAGLSLGIAAYAANCLGSPLRLTIVLHNGTDRIVRWLTPYYARTYEYRVIDLRTHRRIPERAFYRSGDDVYSLGPQVRPGETAQTSLRLDDIVALDEPGIYSVALTAKRLNQSSQEPYNGAISNTIVITINKC